MLYHRQRPEKVRTPGRPRAIPAALDPVIVELYKNGYGFRAIAAVLKQDYHINLHFSSVRKALIRVGEVRGV